MSRPQYFNENQYIRKSAKWPVVENIKTSVYPTRYSRVRFFKTDSPQDR